MRHCADEKMFEKTVQDEMKWIEAEHTKTEDQNVIAPLLVTFRTQWEKV